METIKQIVALAEVARREGLLSLENHMEEISDKFLAGAIRMATDGMTPEFLEKMMSLEIDAKRLIFFLQVFGNPPALPRYSNIPPKKAVTE